MTSAIMPPIYPVSASNRLKVFYPPTDLILAHFGYCFFILAH